MDTIEYSKIQKILDIYDNFHVELDKLKNDYFLLLKKQNQDASELDIENLRSKIQNL